MNLIFKTQNIIKKPTYIKINKPQNKMKLSWILK